MEKSLEKSGPRRASRSSSIGTGTLEKKNKDLNQATKELEAKVKNLQQRTRSLPKPKVQSRSSSRSSLRELPTTPGLADDKSDEKDKKKGSTVTSRIREREAEFTKQVHERDEQIQRLKERLKIVSTRLSDTKEKDLKFPKDREKHAQATLDDGQELQHIIRQVTKERLQLERHLQFANDSLQRNNGVDLNRFIALESTNQHLKQQLSSLEVLQQEYKLVEIQHREKEEACKELLNTLKYKSSLVEDLESQLAKVIEKNTELTIQNSDLQKKVVELHQVTDECAKLKNSLNAMETECVSAKSEVRNLFGKVRNLECVLEEMHKAAENRREIERQHKEALENLKKKQGEVESIATKKQSEIIDQLKSKISELEVERKVQNEKHQELILEMAELKRYGRDVLPEEIENPSDNIEIDTIMAKLEQDNKFLADLEKQRAATVGGKGDDSPPHIRAGSAITDSGFLSQSSLNGTSSSSPVTRESKSSYHHQSELQLPKLSGADKINLLNGGTFSASSASLNNLSGNFNNSREVLIDKDGMVEVPGKGWCWVYVAKYSYDPFQHSPNDTPEAELAINAGDYVLVWSDPDEDGFFDGEILDGRKGLVPSNFVERLEGETLIEFYQSVFLGIGDGDSVCTSIAQDLDFISSDEGYEESKKYFSSRKATLSHYASCTDLDMTEDEGDASDCNGGNDDNVAPPRHLTLETQMNKSFVIGWSAPDCPAANIDHYEVIIDGEVKADVKHVENDDSATMKTIVHGYDFGQTHRISVKTVGRNKKSSHEAACTMVVGKDAPLGPTRLKATRVRTTSASISWLPSSSNFLHTLCLNNVEVRTVKQGVYKHTIAGLTPNTLYKVTVRAKNIKAAPYMSGERNVSKQLETLSSHLELRTLPQGLPDPPVDVQVGQGPNPGTLSVMWLPVTITQFGLSNGAPVTGYIVYADGEKVIEVDDGTADTATLVLNDENIKKITVRTKSNDKLSAESAPYSVPQSLMAAKTKKTSQVKNSEDSDDSESELIEKLQKHPSVSAPRSRELIINYNGYPDIDSDIGPSELSDIAEEPEEEYTDSDNEMTTSKTVTKKFDLTNMYKNPLLNNNSVSQWSNTLKKQQQLPAQSSQVSNSQFEAQKSQQTTTNNKNVSEKTGETNYSNTTVSNVTPVTVTTNGNSNAKERMRIFVALFDYDPPTMSPNPDACDEELPFREGQLIKVYGEKDADGFYWGEAGSRSGFVPCNMVSEVQVDDERVAEELFREQAGSSASQKADRAGSVERDERWADIYEDMPVKRKIALYDYDPTELSPNVDSEVELAFKTGEILMIFGDMDDDGFFMAELGGKRGLVPSNFLTDLPPGYDPTKNIYRQTQPRVLGQQRTNNMNNGRW